MSEIPALYGQYDDEGNPLWMDGAVRRMFALRAENERLRDLLHQGRAYVWSFAHTNAEDMRARMVLGDIDDALKSGEIHAEPQK